MKNDSDLVVDLAPSNADTVVRSFTPDYYVSRDAVTAAIADRTIFNLIHHESVIKVDCIVRKDSRYRRVEFDRRQRIEIEDFSIWIVSKEDLIVSKLEWLRDSGSELQMRDVRNLVATGYDREYVEDWAVQLGLSDLWQECRRCTIRHRKSSRSYASG